MTHTHDDAIRLTLTAGLDRTLAWEGGGSVASVAWTATQRGKNNNRTR